MLQCFNVIPYYCPHVSIENMRLTFNVMHTMSKDTRCIDAPLHNIYVVVRDVESTPFTAEMVNLT